MAVNKVVYGGETLVDLTDTTATEETVAEGVTFYGADGVKRTGTYDGVTQEELAAELAKYLPLAGGTMTGDINLGTNRGFIGTTASGNKFDIFRLVNATKLQVGGSYPELLLKGKNVRPTYNDNEIALMSDVNKKADDYSIEIYNNIEGNPRPIKFISVDYTSCTSSHAVAIKLGMVSGHGNGISYTFLQDVIIKVTNTGIVTVDNFKYYGASTGTYEGANRQYGDIFWVHNRDTKVIDFYVLMGNYARVNMTPWKRVTYSTGGSITQYSSAIGYSEGTKEWGNNSEFALMSDVNALRPTITADATSGAKSLTLNINNSNTEWRYTNSSGITSLTLNDSGTFEATSEAYYTVVFISGSTATTITNAMEANFTGDDCEDGVFTPVANKTYEVGIWWNGLLWQAVVKGV